MLFKCRYYNKASNYLFLDIEHKNKFFASFGDDHDLLATKEMEITRTIHVISKMKNNPVSLLVPALPSVKIPQES